MYDSTFNLQFCIQTQEFLVFKLLIYQDFSLFGLLFSCYDARLSSPFEVRAAALNAKMTMIRATTGQDQSEYERCINLQCAT
jgi:hypothetical protein